MSQARFIVSDNKYLCNICSDPISKDKIISLKCNPDKHIFCYDCIKEWYCEISNKKKHKHHHENYTIITMCPICRCNGGLLPVYKNDIPIKGVNNMINIIPINIPSQKVLSHKCNAKFKTKEGYCQSLGKPMYNGFCGLH